MSKINWNLVTEQDLAAIDKIVERACEEYDIKDKMGLLMDITATHINGTSLDLEMFFGFDRFNFAHDVYGIMANLNRNNGKIENGFLPRCAK